MLCHRCSRLAATVARRSSTTLAQRTRLLPTSSLLPARSSALLRPVVVGRTGTRHVTARLYSSSSDSTSATDSAESLSTTPSGPEKPDYLDEAESAIWDKLVAEFNPTALLVQDISGGCGSMYGIEISSEKFRGVNMLKQQRMVNAVLGDQMKGWHGVQLRTKVP
ncbi:bola-like protein [Hypomontagnella submonticulosa]|nr:bola-like protein [Hypomontagnella submonticulosa]